ncbi:hypothetical protein A5724_04415 [Mycobacterium sp. ACS1612]|uniref:hypothetical protein n=1 Tax=Mycobacterium sp. ACS1612 TaxID=1834117 RepID=UPI0007FD61DA|nr:hypothetical protein [Mycobacterium sp. ACS1612]OBF25630.1 hypothetical protein A5724_04415 [Mycobacterium sp. ACS1612]
MTAAQQSLEAERDTWAESSESAADNIAVLSADGTVEDSGTRAEAITRGGQHAEFWAQHASATGSSMAGSATYRRTLM